jgi:hypothetical protein
MRCLAVDGASNVSAIKYDRENGKRQYKAGEGADGVSGVDGDRGSL